MGNLIDISAPKKRPSLINLYKIELFSKCNQSDIFLIEKYCIQKNFDASSIVFDKGDLADGIYIVVSGNVEIISHSLSGKEIIHNIISKGGSFGEIGFFDRGVRTASARAKGNLHTLFLSIVDFDKISDQLSREYWMATVSLLCSLLRRNSSYIEDVHFFTAKERIAFQLYRLCNEKAFAQQDGSKTVLEISQEKLAQMLGLTREITNKVLSQLEAEQLIGLRRGQISILNREGLNQPTGDNS